MTKRLKLLYQDQRPADAPDVVWMPDDADLEHITTRIPGAVGYVDLDRGHVEAQPGKVDEARILALRAEGRRQLGRTGTTR